MAPEPTPPLPGSMTVPPLFGWETIVAVLLLLLVVAVAFFLASATGRAPSGQSEFQAWLDARSNRHREFPEPVPGDGAPLPARTKDDAPNHP
jgi:hypothetical protein